jgi:hypothetical protein
MYNNYYLVKRIEEEQGSVSFASVQDSFHYQGEVIETPVNQNTTDHMPQVGDKIIFLKGSGEDIGEFKAIKFEDIIKKI